MRRLWLLAPACLILACLTLGAAVDILAQEEPEEVSPPTEAIEAVAPSEPQENPEETPEPGDDSAADASSLPASGDDAAYAPDRPEPGSVEQIREFTTAPEFLPEPVSYLPDSDSVPSPSEFLGHLVGAPDELSRTAEVHGYFRRLAEASDRVDVRTIGTSEEGREILLAVVSDAANLERLEELRETTARLADPRATTRAEARALAAEGKVFYYLTGGLHSSETGSPEMLMELAYRLAVSERPEIRAIREDAVVLITPVIEVDGRDRQVDWFYRNVRGKDLPWEDITQFDTPPYWGRYAFHDNNRDGMQRALAQTRALCDTFFAFHPQVMHDLHESVPLLYISTGHGPYNRTIDPVTINEWTQLAHHEAGELAAQGLPGVWTWGFWDGWWPGYVNSVATNHNSIARFYETFGNGSAATFERRLDQVKYLGKPVSEAQWYRPWPPGKRLRWSLRNNVNYMQAGVLEALSYAALHRGELLESFWVKGNRALEKGRSEAPYAWVFPPDQRDPARLAHLVDQLRAQRVEVHRLTADARLGGRTYRAGSYVVRMDQPYRNAAVNFLEVQKFPEDEPNPSYDDVAWTWPLLYGVQGSRLDDRAVLEAAMEPVAADVELHGNVSGTGEDVFLLRDTGQTALLRARLLLGEHQVDAAEVAFSAGGTDYPAGSWIVQAPREAVERVAAETGLDFQAAAMPHVKRHVVDLPRLGVLHTWTDTQDAGWVRYTLDREGMAYALVAPEDVRRGGLAERFDVILFPDSQGQLADLVHGIDRRFGPLPYEKTSEYPSLGEPNSSPDVTVGMGFEGLANLQAFVEGGGVLAAIANAGTLAVDGGLVRRVNRASGEFNTPGSELQAKVLRPDHPIAYGYEELPSVFRGNGPLWDLADADRGLAVLQFGTKQVPEEESAAATGDIEVEDVDVEGGASSSSSSAAKPKESPADKGELVLSGMVKGKDQVDGKPAILDVPVGKGRVILFAFNPLHRYLNLSDFRFAYNALLNWNDLPR